MLKWSSLCTREHGRVKQRRHHLHLALRSGLAPWVREIFAHQDHTTTRTTQGLVCGRGYDMRVFHRVFQKPCCYQACWVSHIHHEECTYLIGHFANTSVIPVAAICTRACDNEFGLLLTGHLFQLIVIHTASILFHIVLQCVEHQSRKVYWRTMAEVTAVAEVQTKEGVASLQTCHKNGHIGLRTRVRLYVGILCIK